MCVFVCVCHVMYVTYVTSLMNPKYLYVVGDTIRIVLYRRPHPTYLLWRTYTLVMPDSVACDNV